jgi:hypothetical protein
VVLCLSGSAVIGVLLASLQPGNKLIGVAVFSSFLLISFLLMFAAGRWSHGGKIILWMIFIAFGLRLVGGVLLYILLPVDGYDDPDDRAGYVYTDAHRRDDQAWQVAGSDRPILDAFSRKYAADQYGGLLAFYSLLYRLFSPDGHRSFLLIIPSATIAALGLPFLWRSASLVWGETIATAAGWIYVLYPESVLLGGAAMREPFLIALGAFALAGFVLTLYEKNRSGWTLLGVGFIGSLLISPAIALYMILLFGGWYLIRMGRERPSWWLFLMVVLVFIASLIILSVALNRQGQFDGSSPLGIVFNFFRSAVSWDVYQLERGSGWIQKLFDEMPGSWQLPFVIIYGVFQPVLPAALVEPTTFTWQTIGVLRAAGWYALLPLLVVSSFTFFSFKDSKERWIGLWLGLLVWVWIILAALRGGGDQWDNPRYRAILFLWQAILAGMAWQLSLKGRKPWFFRVAAMEGIFLIVFGQWYVSRYLQVGWRLDFLTMVGFILACWALIAIRGWYLDRRRLTGRDQSL